MKVVIKSAKREAYLLEGKFQENVRFPEVIDSGLLPRDILVSGVSCYLYPVNLGEEIDEAILAHDRFVGYKSLLTDEPIAEVISIEELR